MRQALRSGWLVLLALLAVQAWGMERAETQKIEALIAHVQLLRGASFIRNGTEYTAQEAADHLRLKWGKAGTRVVTAEDFIRLCASKSYFSGTPYQLRFADGRVLEAGPYLTAVLAGLNGAARKVESPPGRIGQPPAAARH